MRNLIVLVIFTGVTDGSRTPEGDCGLCFSLDEFTDPTSVNSEAEGFMVSRVEFGEAKDLATNTNGRSWEEGSSRLEKSVLGREDGLAGGGGYMRVGFILDQCVQIEVLRDVDDVLFEK